jgi:hypothetical protein
MAFLLAETPGCAGCHLVRDREHLYKLVCLDSSSFDKATVFNSRAPRRWPYLILVPCQRVASEHCSWIKCLPSWPLTVGIRLHTGMPWQVP